MASIISKPDSTFTTILPPELWYEIFGHLDYEDLKYTIPLVCKTFRKMVNRSSTDTHTAVDRILFRDSPQIQEPKVADIRNFKVHPCLQGLFSLMIVKEKEGERVALVGHEIGYGMHENTVYSIEHELEAFLADKGKTEAWDEYAVSPAVTCLHVYTWAPVLACRGRDAAFPCISEAQKLNCVSGVRVFDLMVLRAIELAFRFLPISEFENGDRAVFFDKCLKWILKRMKDRIKAPYLQPPGVINSKRKVRSEKDVDDLEIVIRKTGPVCCKMKEPEK